MMSYFPMFYYRPGLDSNGCQVATGKHFEKQATNLHNTKHRDSKQRNVQPITNIRFVASEIFKLCCCYSRKPESYGAAHELAHLLTDICFRDCGKVNQDVWLFDVKSQAKLSKSDMNMQIDSTSKPGGPD